MALLNDIFGNTDDKSIYERTFGGNMWKTITTVDRWFEFKRLTGEKICVSYNSIAFFSERDEQHCNIHLKSGGDSIPVKSTYADMKKLVCKEDDKTA
jgi:hypothetical protein